MVSTGDTFTLLFGRLEMFLKTSHWTGSEVWLQHSASSRPFQFLHVPMTILENSALELCMDARAGILINMGARRSVASMFGAGQVSLSIFCLVLMPQVPGQSAAA